jgi:hypothetical protein
MKNNISIGAWSVLLIVCYVAFQSFAYVDCFQQFNSEMYAAELEYTEDVKRCRFAWPPGLCMPEASLSLDKAIDDAIAEFKECVK